MSATRKISDLAAHALDMILPPRCSVSGDFVDQQGMISPDAFASLEFITAPYCESCGLPFEFEVESKTKCIACLTDPPAFKTARAAMRYGDVSRTMILEFKHGDKTHIASSFVPWLKRAGSEMLEQADALIPVPLHYRRLLMRRYNQADLIAKALAQDTGLPCLSEALKRTRSTPSQGHLKAEERAKNVRRAFAVDEGYLTPVKGAKLVLIDDVYTTGSTVKECAKALLRAGASEVSALTLARVVKGDMQD